MIMLILAPLVGVLGALLLAYGAWLIYPPAGFVVAGALLRGDMKSRFEAYATGINWGIYSPNDCRDLEDMNPRPGGDVYLTPMNMTTKPSDGSKAGKQKDNANADETTS